MNGKRKGQEFYAAYDTVIVHFVHDYCRRVDEEVYDVKDGEAWVKDNKYENFQCFSCDEEKEKIEKKDQQKAHDAWCSKNNYPYYKSSECSCKIVWSTRDGIVTELENIIFPDDEESLKKTSEEYRLGYLTAWDHAINIVSGGKKYNERKDN
jgi:hypothetical protein